MRYVALLRGINVGGARKVAMGDLKNLFESLACRDVATFIQSGNIIFTSGKSPGPLARSIERVIERDLGHTVRVILRSGDQMEGIFGSNPYAGRGLDPSTLHVTFLAGPAATASPESPPPDGDSFEIAGNEIYLHCPSGYGRTKWNNTFFERRLGVPATTRNWKTVSALREMTASATKG